MRSLPPHLAPTHADDALTRRIRRRISCRKEVWRAIIGLPGDEHEEVKCLSLMRFGILDDLQPARELSSAFFDAVRRSAAFHTKGKAAGTIMQGPTTKTSIRVNRVGGPFGHLDPGADLHAYRLLLCSKLVTGAQPRHWWAAILVCVQQPGGAICSMPSFYIGMRGGSRAAVVTPPHHAVPRQGFVGEGSALNGELREDSHSRELVEMARRYTATTYDGALLLADLAIARPDLPAVSPTAVCKTLHNYERHLRTFQAGNAAPSTRSQEVSPYQAGDRVFAQWGTDDDELFFPATIRRVQNDGTYAVGYLDGSTEDDASATCKPASRIRPDIVFSQPNKARTLKELGVGAPDPEEMHDDTPARMAALIASRGRQVS